MKNGRIKGKRRLLLILLAAFTIVAGFLIYRALAFYTQSLDTGNDLSVAGSAVALGIWQIPADTWVAGETKEKEVTFTNRGDADLVLRFSVQDAWKDGGNSWTSTDVASPAVINWTDEITGGTSAWTKIGDYYYYNQVFEKRADGTDTVTPAVIDSVTFSGQMSNGGTAALLSGDGADDSRGRDDFSGKRYELGVQMETLEVDASIVSGSWGVSMQQMGTDISWS